MQQIQVSRHVSAPVESVWAVATDLPGAPAVVRAVQSVEVLTDGPFGVGTRWRETRTMFGTSATEEMTITAVEPQRSYTAEADSRGAHYSSTFTFVPAAGGTDVTAGFAGTPTGRVAAVVAALTGPLARRSVVSALRADLDDIAAAAEAR